MKIRKLTEKDFKKVMNVIKKLHGKWFTNGAIKKEIPIDIKINKGFIAEENNRVLGFLTYTSYEGKVELGWFGVDPKLHRKGVGTALFKKVEKEIKKTGTSELRVDTLSEKEKYKPYERTRAFYQKMGFRLEKTKKRKDKYTGKKFYMATYLKKI